MFPKGDINAIATLGYSTRYNNADGTYYTFEGLSGKIDRKKYNYSGTLIETVTLSSDGRYSTSTVVIAYTDNKLYIAISNGAIARVVNFDGTVLKDFSTHNSPYYKVVIYDDYFSLFYAGTTQILRYDPNGTLVENNGGYNPQNMNPGRNQFRRTNPTTYFVRLGYIDIYVNSLGINAM